MSYKPGNVGWRDAQLAAAETRQTGPRGGAQRERNEMDGDHHGLSPLVGRGGALALVVVVLAVLGYLLLHRVTGHHPVHSTPPVPRVHRAGPTITRTAWTSAEAQPFASGMWGVVTVPSARPHTGPAALWPALPAARSIHGGTRLAVLGTVGNSQESSRWVAALLPGNDVGWLPDAMLAITGTVRLPPGGRPDSYVITGPRPLTAWRRPALPVRPASVPTAVALATVGPGSVLPLRGVLPRYFDGRVGTAWVRVHLPDGSFGWLYQERGALRRDLRYLLPPPHATTSPWAAPLAARQTLLGAYGEPLRTTQWPVRGGTLVRGRAGDPVMAAADGVVIFTGYSVRWGRYIVVVRHNGTWEGWQTAYLGLDVAPPHALRVAEGAAVHRGEVLGYLAQGSNQQPTSLLFVVQTPDGTPIESQNVIQWP